MANNLISYEMTQERVNEIKTKINELNQLLDFAVILTPDERNTLPAMGDKTVAFVEKSLEMAKNNQHILPAYFDMHELQRDLTVSKQINPLIAELETVLSKLTDTSLASGSEAYLSALVFYNSVKSAHKSNVSGAESLYNELKQRFPGRSKAKKNQETV